MHASAHASDLARTLLALARARATGVLTIRDGAHRQTCELTMLHGYVHACARMPEPFGTCDVHAALARALRWTSVRTSFAPQAVDGCAALAPWSMSELLLRAAEHALASEPLASFTSAHMYVERSAFGSALERRGARLLPEALAQDELYLRPQQLAQLSDAELSRMRAALWLGALVPRQGAARAYTLLLRKHRQLRTQADPHALLELERGARPADARRALRRLASRLHPDALGPAAPPALRALSSELMCALVQAERAVRGDARA